MRSVYRGALRAAAVRTAAGPAAAVADRVGPRARPTTLRPCRPGSTLGAVTCIMSIVGGRPGPLDVCAATLPALGETAMNVGRPEHDLAPGPSGCCRARERRVDRRSATRAAGTLPRRRAPTASAGDRVNVLVWNRAPVRRHLPGGRFSRRQTGAGCGAAPARPSRQTGRSAARRPKAAAHHVLVIARVINYLETWIYRWNRPPAATGMTPVSRRIGVRRGQARSDRPAR